MSKPANKTMIGLFVLGAIALVVIAIATLRSGKLFKKTTTAVCYFEGSVGGLDKGAPVVFRGVKIGTVKEIAFRFDPKKYKFDEEEKAMFDKSAASVKETHDALRKLVEL